jgi:adenylate kinase family enzyme
MRRIVILGRGGAGKSTLAARLGATLALPVIELDKHFWAPDLTPTPKDQWAQIQRRLTSGEQWVIDGDLGPYDVLDVRLQAADTVIVLDFPLWRCAWRALRRSRENLAFWRWLLAYRRRSLPTIMVAIAANAGRADLHLLRNPRAVEQLLTRANAIIPPDQGPLTNP